MTTPSSMETEVKGLPSPPASDDGFEKVSKEEGSSDAEMVSAPRSPEGADA
jgi:hypothetical protein